MVEKKKADQVGKEESLDVLRRELIASRHEVALLRREIEHLRANSLLWIANLGAKK